MDAVKTHYDKLLGSVYSWILGDFDSAATRNARLFERLDVSPINTGVAVDLGAGPGNQSIPLIDRGFDVVAVDFCETLLNELRSHPGGGDVKAVLADIAEFRRHINVEPDLIVCMGDTLVHLPEHPAAEKLLADIAEALGAGGSVVISIRDYDAPGPTGTDRFIPIRSSDSQIFTCFLEYEEDVVHVHDILQRKQDGEWTLSVSGYRKLRIGMDWVTDKLSARGLVIVDRFEDDGMLILHARK